MTEGMERFERDLATVCWRELRIHLRRDAVVTVAASLDLIRVATAVVDDDATQVADWIADRRLGKPTADQLQQWEGDLQRPFRMLIVQPYILIQEV